MLTKSLNKSVTNLCQCHQHSLYFYVYMHHGPVWIHEITWIYLGMMFIICSSTRMCEIKYIGSFKYQSQSGISLSARFRNVLSATQTKVLTICNKQYHWLLLHSGLVWFNATFNNISVISWWFLHSEYWEIIRCCISILPFSWKTMKFDAF